MLLIQLTQPDNLPEISYDAYCGSIRFQILAKHTNVQQSMVGYARYFLTHVINASVVTFAAAYARFPSFRCRSSVAVSAFPLSVAVSVHRCRCLCCCISLCLTERNFLTYFLQNNGILQRQKGETATEERQRNGGNRALASEIVFLGVSVRRLVYITTSPARRIKPGSHTVRQRTATQCVDQRGLLSHNE